MLLAVDNMHQVGVYIVWDERFKMPAVFLFVTLQIVDTVVDRPDSFPDKTFFSFTYDLPNIPSINWAAKFETDRGDLLIPTAQRET